MNTINFHKSMRYNPFAYIHEEKDILKLVTTLMTNTKGEGQGGDPFWDKAERLLLTSLIAYLHYEAPAEEQNFATLLEMLNTMQVSEDDEDYQNPVDLLFEDLAKKKPNSFAGRQYKLYKLAAGKTAKSILISCGARLSPFDIQEIRDATMYDELELDKLGDRKTALFLIMSDTDSTFNFLICIRGLRRTADCHLSEQCWIPCPLWKVLASGQLARNGRQPDLHGRSPLRRCPLRIDARTPDHPAGGV